MIADGNDRRKKTVNNVSNALFYAGTGNMLGEEDVLKD
jgi:hypothetical protein